MTLSLSGRQIFLASPGGLNDERAQVRLAVDKHNRLTAFRNGVAFIARGWEEVPGGIGRPQELINAMLAECDFTIVMLADRWGSTSGHDSYTSATEEEFMVALELCRTEDANMRDVLVLFRSVPAQQLADPGEQLRSVLGFKERLEKSRGIMFDTFDDSESLAEKIDSILTKWGGNLETRTLTTFELAAPGDEVSDSNANNILERALELAGAGRMVQAETLLAKASQTGDPKSLGEYARFLRRQGRLNDSSELNGRVVTELASKERMTGPESGYLSDSLANIGVIARKKGHLTESLRTLREAVDVAEQALTPVPNELAYALDNLGHTLNHLQLTEEAEQAFERAERSRTEAGDTDGLLRSKLNRGWLAIRTGAHERAEQLFAEVVASAREIQDDETLARALTGRGNSLMEANSAAEALAPLEEARAINAALGQSDGVGIAAAMLARAYVSTGDARRAQEAANAALAEAQRSANITGLANAKWALAQIARSNGNISKSAALFDEAIELAAATGNSSLDKAIRKDYSAAD